MSRIWTWTINTNKDFMIFYQFLQSDASVKSSKQVTTVLEFRLYCYPDINDAWITITANLQVKIVCLFRITRKFHSRMWRCVVGTYPTSECHISEDNVAVKTSNFTASKSPTHKIIFCLDTRQRVSQLLLCTASSLTYVLSLMNSTVSWAVCCSTSTLLAFSTAVQLDSKLSSSKLDHYK